MLRIPRYSIIFFWTQGSFSKILACNLMRYCICLSYCCYTCDLNILGTRIEASVPPYWTGVWHISGFAGLFCTSKCRLITNLSYDPHPLLPSMPTFSYHCFILFLEGYGSWRSWEVFQAMPRGRWLCEKPSGQFLGLIVMSHWLGEVWIQIRDSFVFVLSLFRSENHVYLSRGVQVAGVAWCAATRTVAGVGDLVQTTGDGRTGQVLSGWAV
jgi:hypothetical protein